MKQIAAVLCAGLLLLACIGCGGGPAISLTDEEKDILDQMGTDVHQVAETDWAATVPELQAHPGEFSGQVYQFEAAYHASGEINGTQTAYISRTLVNGNDKTELRIPVSGMPEKEVPDGAWIRLSAIVETGEYGGETMTALMVFAVETPEKPGNAELTWDGPTHNHT